MAARYKILEELGAGGAGAVFKAYDTQLDRYVAIKRLLSKEEAEHEDSRSGDIKNEAASLATLQHPNVVSVFDLGSDDQGFFMVMELVDGETLADWVSAQPMGLADFQELATQTLEAIVSAHSHNIQHRDLKPENIKVRRLPSGRLQVKVLDFGLARLSYRAKKMTEDQSGNVLGSIYYMAPEQFMRKPVDGRTDLYSLGCVLYQALSCRRPFEGETVKDVMDAHLNHQVYPLNQVTSEVPQPVCDWVMWLFNVDPAHRPANAQQALNSFRGLAVAGWLAENSEPIAVAIAEPDVVYARPAPAPVPSGVASQRIITNGPQRPNPTATRRPSGSVPPLGRPAPKKSSDDDDDEEGKSKLNIWLYALGGVMLVGLAAWLMMRDKGKPAGQAGTTDGIAITSPAANGTAAPQLKERAADFIEPRAILHYRAGQKMDAFTAPGAPVVQAQPGQAVVAWHDQAASGGDGALVAYDRLQQNCPIYVSEHPAGLTRTVGMLRFTSGQAMIHTLKLTEPSAADYPLAKPAPDRGLTFVMLVRPSMSGREVRCIRIRNQEDKGYLNVRAYPNGDWKLGMKVGATIKEAKIVQQNAALFNLVGVSWNTTTNKMLLSVRTEDGTKKRAEVEAPKDPAGTFNEVRIADFAGGGPIAIEDKFSGDIVELVVWPYAMEWEQRSGQEFRMVQDYFVNPGTRY